MTQPNLTPDQALAAIEDMYVRRMCGIFSALLRQNGIVVSERELDIAQCIIATVAHELTPLGAESAMKVVEEPAPLIVPGGGS